MRCATCFVLAILASIVVGCSSSSSVPSSPSSTASGGTASSTDQLTGAWNLVSVQAAGEVAQPTPANATYTLTFAEGRLSTRADCNTCGGAFTLSGPTLTVGPALACTRAACATMAFENAYTRVLSGDSTIAFSNGALVLSSPRGVLRFTR